MKLPLLAFLCLVTGFAIAQPTINAAYHGSVRTRGVLNYDFATTPTVAMTDGANQNWTFTLPAGGNTANLTCTQYATAPAGQFLRNCNFSYNLLGSELDSKLYIQQNNNGVNILQLNVASPTLPGASFISGWYTPELALPFNLGFNQSTGSRTYTSVDSIYLPGVPSGPNSYKRETDTVRYTGYGTCTINGQRLTNVIKITRRIATSDGDTRNGPFTLESLSQEEIFFAPGLGYPLLVKTTRRFPAPTTVEISYMGAVVTNLKPVVAAVPFAMFPNPAVDHVTVDLPGEGTLTVSDLAGKRIAIVPFANKEADVSMLSPGLYTVEAIVSGKVYRTKVTVH